MKTYYIVKGPSAWRPVWYCMGMPWTLVRKEAFRFRSLRAAQSMALKLRGENRVIKVTVKPRVPPVFTPSLEHRVYCALALIDKEIQGLDDVDVVKVDAAEAILRGIRSKLTGK